MSSISSQTTRKELVKRADDVADETRSDLRGDNRKLRPEHAIARTGVLAAHTLGFDVHRATVRLWTTTVRGNSKGGEAPKAAFHSVTVSLVWEANAWKLAGSSAGQGLVAPVDTRQATNVAADFADYTSHSSRGPVFSGVTATDGLPSAYPRDRGGARAAATNAVMLYGDSRFFTDTGWRHRMLKSTAAPSVMENVLGEADSTARMVTENRGLGSDGKTLDGGLLVTRTAVLGSRCVTYSDQAASFELWTTSVGGIAGADEEERPQVNFLRMTVDLAWSGGTWRTTSVAPSQPLVPNPPVDREASPAQSFASVGGASNAPSLA
ncbi:putative integral membrane protein (plasmid) [Streptomyces alboflavus]|uniref:Putative integral membrane protein n=1 Tax=Streptomyces alboflavus TaxID=67267 RepID=A0A291W463_9ACTN|nr:putative integral membrane protein [Streptomyces alboflavus]